jgi:hypothetical protein
MTRAEIYVGGGRDDSGKKEKKSQNNSLNSSLHFLIVDKNSKKWEQHTREQIDFYVDSIPAEIVHEQYHGPWKSNSSDFANQVKLHFITWQ